MKKCSQPKRKMRAKILRDCLGLITETIREVFSTAYPRIHISMHILQSILKYVTRSWYPVPMCDVRVFTYPGIYVFHRVSAYPRIHFSTSQYSLKFTWGRVVLSTAYPRIQPFQRCSFKMAGYSAVKPLFSIDTSKKFLLLSLKATYQYLFTFASIFVLHTCKAG